MFRNETQRKIWALAWPAIVGNISQTLLNLVDTLMVGHVSALAIAAVGLGGQVSWFMFPIMMAVSVGTLALIARFVGAKDYSQAELVLEQSLYLAFLLGIPVMLFGWFFGDEVLWVMGAKGELLRTAYAYLKVVFLFYPIRLVGFTLFSALRERGIRRLP